METVLVSLNKGLHKVLELDERVYLLGEDILDPYGGSFKVTKGLSTVFPERVLVTPISEAGITGIATGMAMRGLLPVVEIMFGDFIALIADQVINHLTKFAWMYGQGVQTPVVIRTPMGGRRGYGPTHSQTLEKLFMGVPGLIVLAPTSLGDPGELLQAAILKETEPVLFVENKLLYTLKLFKPELYPDFQLQELRGKHGTGGERCYPAYSLSIAGVQQKDLTFVAYGYMVEIAREAMLRLAYEHEIFVELVVPTRIKPLDADVIISSVRQTRHLLVIEEGTKTMGWGAEVVASVAERMSGEIISIHRIAGRDSPIPASGYLEQDYLPSVNDLIIAACSMVKAK